MAAVSGLLKAVVPVLSTVDHWLQPLLLTEAIITSQWLFLPKAALWCLEEVLFVILDAKTFQRFLVLSIGFLISVPGRLFWGRTPGVL